MTRARPRVTDAQMDRLARFLRAMGAKIAAADIFPDGSYKVVTTDGAYLISPGREPDSWSDMRKAAQ